jgi:hypothetical protein
MDIWDEGNLKALGIKKETKKYTIKIDGPITVTISEQEKYFNFRSVLIRNDIPVIESVEENVCKN